MVPGVSEGVLNTTRGGLRVVRMLLIPLFRSPGLIGIFTQQLAGEGDTSDEMGKPGEETHYTGNVHV